MGFKAEERLSRLVIFPGTQGKASMYSHFFKTFDNLKREVTWNVERTGLKTNSWILPAGSQSRLIASLFRLKIIVTEVKDHGHIHVWHIQAILIKPDLPFLFWHVRLYWDQVPLNTNHHPLILKRMLAWTCAAINLLRSSPSLAEGSLHRSTVFLKAYGALASSIWGFGDLTRFSEIKVQNPR